MLAAQSAGPSRLSELAVSRKETAATLVPTSRATVTRTRVFGFSVTGTVGQTPRHHKSPLLPAPSRPPSCARSVDNHPGHQHYSTANPTIWQSRCQRPTPPRWRFRHRSTRRARTPAHRSPDPSPRPAAWRWSTVLTCGAPSAASFLCRSNMRSTKLTIRSCRGTSAGEIKLMMLRLPRGQTSRRPFRGSHDTTGREVQGKCSELGTTLAYARIARPCSEDQTPSTVFTAG